MCLRPLLFRVLSSFVVGKGDQLSSWVSHAGSTICSCSDGSLSICNVSLSKCRSCRSLSSFYIDIFLFVFRPYSTYSYRSGSHDRFLSPWINNEFLVLSHQPTRGPSSYSGKFPSYKPGNNPHQAIHQCQLHKYLALPIHPGLLRNADAEAIVAAAVCCQWPKDFPS